MTHDIYFVLILSVTCRAIFNSLQGSEQDISVYSKARGREESGYLSSLESNFNSMASVVRNTGCLAQC